MKRKESRHSRCVQLRRLLRVSWKDHCTNQSILDELKQKKRNYLWTYRRENCNTLAPSRVQGLSIPCCTGISMAPGHEKDPGGDGLDGTGLSASRWHKTEKHGDHWCHSVRPSVMRMDEERRANQTITAERPRRVVNGIYILNLRGKNSKIHKQCLIVGKQLTKPDYQSTCSANVSNCALPENYVSLTHLELKHFLSSTVSIT